MKVIAVSDLHGQLPELGPCDLLLIGGDNSPYEDHGECFQRHWYETVWPAWLLSQPARHVVWIAGNHDLILSFEAPLELGPNIHYLNDSGVEIEGLRVFGSPWSISGSMDWAFALPTEEEPGGPTRCAEIYGRIPEGTDILLVHGAPYGIGDQVKGSWRSVGSKALLRRIEHVRPAYTVFGHIHEGYGRYEHDGLELVNAAQMNFLYAAVNPPVELEL